MSGKRRSTQASSSRRGSSRLSQADREALSQLDHLLELQRRRERLAAQVPTDIVTERLQGERGATIYRFSHRTLGPLGRLHIIPVPFMNATTVEVDMAESDPETDPHWVEKYQALKAVTDLCVQALPGSQPGASPMPPLEEARVRRQLYLRLLGCQHSVEMFGLAKSLSQPEYDLLIDTCETALRTTSGTDRLGIEQRVKELRFYWQDLQDRPLV